MRFLSSGFSSNSFLWSHWRLSSWDDIKFELIEFLCRYSNSKFTHQWCSRWRMHRGITIFENAENSPVLLLLSIVFHIYFTRPYSSYNKLVSWHFCRYSAPYKGLKCCGTVPLTLGIKICDQTFNSLFDLEQQLKFSKKILNFQFTLPFTSVQPQALNIIHYSRESLKRSWELFFLPETYLLHVPESCTFLNCHVSRAVYTMNRTNIVGGVQLNSVVPPPHPLKRRRGGGGPFHV